MGKIWLMLGASLVLSACGPQQNSSRTSEKSPLFDKPTPTISASIQASGAEVAQDSYVDMTTEALPAMAVSCLGSEEADSRGHYNIAISALRPNYGGGKAHWGEDTPHIKMDLPVTTNPAVDGHLQIPEGKIHFHGLIGDNEYSKTGSCETTLSKEAAWISFEIKCGALNRSGPSKSNTTYALELKGSCILD